MVYTHYICLLINPLQYAKTKNAIYFSKNKRYSTTHLINEINLVHRNIRVRVSILSAGSGLHVHHFHVHDLNSPLGTWMGYL